MSLALALALPLRAQLVVPTDLPSTSSNFKLRAHTAAGNNTLGLQIANWVVAFSGQSTCHELGQLTGDDNRGQDFWVNVESGIIQAEQGGTRRILTLEEDQTGKKVLKLECGEEAISQVGISFEGSTPVLALERDRDSQFYACQNMATGAVGVFYRQTRNEALTPGCIDVDLALECTSGPDHGETQLAACCTKIHNGKCLRE